METVLKAIADWIKGILTAGIMSNLSGLFDDVNTQVGNIAQQVGTKPSSFEPRVFAMIEALSRNVVLPIAGIILTFIYDFLSQKVDVHGACLAPELIEQFVEVVTPIADYSYRWKLNTGCKKSKEERTDLMAVSEKPILTFTIDFETAKRYREANKMPHQFRRAAWTDLTVEVYL